MTEETRKQRPIPRQTLFDMGKAPFNTEALESRVGPRAARAMRIEYLKRRDPTGVTPPRKYYAVPLTEKKRVITEEEYRFRVGRSPEPGDLERCNCPKAGVIGHFQCGWDTEANLPRFMTYGRGPQQKLLPANTEISCQALSPTGKVVTYGYLTRPVLLGDLTQLFTDIQSGISKNPCVGPHMISSAVEDSFRNHLEQRGWVKPAQDPMPDDLTEDAHGS